MSTNSNNTREPAEYASNSEIVYGRVVCGANGVGKTGGELAGVPPALGVGGGVTEEQDRAALAKRLRRRGHYRVAALVAMTLLLLSALATLALSVKVLNDCTRFSMEGSDSSALYILASFLMNIFVAVESVLSAITAITLIALLSCHPERVLIRAPYDSGKFSCLCISLVFLLLFSGYSLAVPIIMDAAKQYPVEPLAFLVPSAVRVVAYACTVGILGANRCLR